MQFSLKHKLQQQQWILRYFSCGKIREELVDLKCELGPSFLLQVVVALSSMSTKEQVHHIFLEGTADELFYYLIKYDIQNAIAIFIIFPKLVKVSIKTRTYSIKETTF